MFRLIAFSMLLLYLFACDSSGDSANSSEMAVCNPSEKRCYGEFVQSCNLLGQWEDIPCPEGYSCFLVNNEPSCEDRNHGGSMPKADMTMSENQDISIPIDMIVGGNQGGSNGGSYAGTTVDMTVVEDTGTTTAGTTAGTPAGSEGGTPAGSEGGTPAGSEGGTPAGSEGGTPAGSEGGTPAGSEGGTPAGIEGGSPAGSIPTGDTVALSCTGDYCPSSRLSSLTLPANAVSADNLGCNLEGVNAGASLSRFLVAVKDLVELPVDIQVDASGQVIQDINLDSCVDPSVGEPTLLLLAQLAGWANGNTGNEQGTADLNFFIGQASRSANRYLINPASLDADGNPLVSFANASVANSALITQPDRSSRFTLHLPMMGIPLSLTLENAQINATLSLDATGFNSETGLISGYFTQDSLVGLVDSISASCAGPSAPDFCAQAGAFLNVSTIESIFGLAAVGGVDGVAYDVKVVDGVASACSGADCNALSVCLKVGMTSTTIEGVGRAQ